MKCCSIKPDKKGRDSVSLSFAKYSSQDFKKHVLEVRYLSLHLFTIQIHVKSLS